MSQVGTHIRQAILFTHLIQFVQTSIILHITLWRDDMFEYITAQEAAENGMYH